MRQPNGFTLIELSIVLVIIGLIVGGIMVGTEMVHDTQLLRTATDAEKYRAAIITFETKYGGPPGDLANATGIWGTASSCPSGTGTGTCNGNGDGHIGSLDNLNAACEESHRAWQQLGAAGLVSGSFTGRHANGQTGFCAARAGENAPEAPAGRGSVFQWASDAQGQASGFFVPMYDNMLLAGGTNNNSGLASFPFLPPAEAEFIDLKNDDGQPGTGHMLASDHAPCSTTNLVATARYNVASTGVGCALLFRP